MSYGNGLGDSDKFGSATASIGNVDSDGVRESLLVLMVTMTVVWIPVLYFFIAFTG